LRPKAQGCEVRATLGSRPIIPQPGTGCVIPDQTPTSLRKTGTNSDLHLHRRDHPQIRLHREESCL